MIVVLDRSDSMSLLLASTVIGIRRTGFSDLLKRKRAAPLGPPVKDFYGCRD
jgi:hypothetical protein